MKHIKRIDWPTLRDWCLAHGAKNDSIVSIAIKGNALDGFLVVLEGHELRNGRPFRENFSGNELAQWRSAETLRSLP